MLEASGQRGSIDVAFPSLNKKQASLRQQGKKRRCHVERGTRSDLHPFGKPNEMSYARCSHISRDVQERVVVVLDRGLLVALVVHFKSREFRTHADGSPVASGARSCPRFLQVTAGGTTAGRLDGRSSRSAARWRPLPRNRNGLPRERSGG